MKQTFLLVLLGMTGLTACGGGGGGNPPVVTNPPPGNTTPTVTTQPAFTALSFSQPVALLQAPGDSSRWFVLEKAGLVRVFVNDENTTSTAPFLDISGIVRALGEGGLLGLAFHPNFPTTPEAFVSYTRTGSPLESYISRFSSTDNGQTLSAATEQVLFTVLQPQSNHNGGDIAFGPDGFLYVGFGDGGGSGDPGENAQDTRNLLGAMVRIDVDGGSPFAIPASNPFSSNANCVQGFGAADCPEIFAWGLRNPWRFSFDNSTGKLWAGDVGQGAFEEIDVITVGENYGWNDREGAHCFDPPNGCADTFREPITEYGRSLGQSVSGGYVYRGSAIADLVGWYVFGDFASGRLFAIPEGSAEGVTPETLNETGLQIVSFGQSVDDELYILDFSSGAIHRIIDAP